MPERISRLAAVLVLGGLAALACRRPDYFPLNDGQVRRYAATGSDLMSRPALHSSLSSLFPVYEVMAREDIIAPAGRFRNCFRIRIHAAEPNVMGFWLASNTGIAQWQRRFSRDRFETARLGVE